MSGFTPKNSWRRPRQALRRVHFVEDQQRAFVLVQMLRIGVAQETGLGMHRSDITVQEWASRRSPAICPGYCFKTVFDALRICEVARRLLERRLIGMHPPPGTNLRGTGIAVIFRLGLDAGRAPCHAVRDRNLELQNLVAVAPWRRARYDRHAS